MPRPISAWVVPVKLSPEARKEIISLLGESGHRFADAAEQVLAAHEPAKAMDRKSGSAVQKREAAEMLSRKAKELSKAINRAGWDQAALIRQQFFLLTGLHLEWDDLEVTLEFLSRAAATVRDGINPNTGPDPQDVKRIIRQLAPAYTATTGLSASHSERAKFPRVMTVLLDDLGIPHGDPRNAVKEALGGEVKRKKS
jgi:hypothetical protein